MNIDTLEGNGEILNVIQTSIKFYILKMSEITLFDDSIVFEAFCENSRFINLFCITSSIVTVNVFHFKSIILATTFTPFGLPQKTFWLWMFERPNTNYMRRFTF